LATVNVDHGFFNGITRPTIALLDADADSYLKLDWSADDAARITAGGGATSLTIGDASVPVTFGAMPLIPTATVAASGTGSGDSPVTTGFTLVTAADGTKAVTLPTAVAGAVCIIKSEQAGQILKIFPNTTDTINGGTHTTGSLDIAAQTIVMLVAYDAADWYSVPLLPS